MPDDVSIDVLKCVLISKHDEALSAMRDCIKRAGEARFNEYATKFIGLFSAQEGVDEATYLLNCFALLGLYHAWISVLDEQD